MALTGLVITRKAGTVRMFKAYQSDKVSVPAGTLLYTLHKGAKVLPYSGLMARRVGQTFMRNLFTKEMPTIHGTFYQFRRPNGG